MSNRSAALLPPAPVLPRALAPDMAPRDVRDLLSFRLALLVTLNDRAAQAELQRRFGFTLGEWRTLALVKALEPVAPGEVALQLVQDVALVSRRIAALVKRGLLLRAISRNDRRSATLRLSAAGRRLHGEIMTYAVPANREVIGDLSPDERRQFWRLLDRILDSVRRENARLRGAPQQMERAA